MLVSIVVVETLVLALLSVVVVALLRSHAEILRRLPEPDAEPERPLVHDEPIDISDGPRLPAHLPSPRRRATEAHDIAGTTPDGDAVAAIAGRQERDWRTVRIGHKAPAILGRVGRYKIR